MSIERPDCDMSDVSVSESSWADAQADTPTMGDGRSDSEDTLSNLSFDNDNDVGVDIQVTGAELPLDGSIGSKHPDENVLDSAGQSHGQPVNVRVQVNDFEMDEDSLQLNLPPGTAYKPPSVDFPTSPSQLKISKGPSFMPTEEPGVISEDESSVNSYRAHLGLNGDVRLIKRDEDSLAPNSYLRLPTAYQLSTEPEPDSLLLEDVDGFDDYIEDFFNPLSNEPVMQRATSFRRKVQKTFEDAVIEKSIKEINNLEAMLSAYDDSPSIDTPSEDRLKSSTPGCGKCVSFSNNCPDCVLHVNKFQSPTGRLSSISRSGVNGGGATIVSNFDGRGDTKNSGDRSDDSTKSNDSGSHQVLFDPDGSINAGDLERGGDAPTTYGRGSDAFADRKKVSSVVRALNFDDMENDSEPQSLLDIDAIVRANAPNLMNSMEPQSLQILHQDQDESSNYFLPKDTITKIESVFDSNNFTNLYTLSGELKHILSPSEIEEIVANKEHLETILSPNIMAALSWSLNDASLPPYTMNNDDSTSFNLQNNLINSREIHNNTNLPIIIESSKDDATTNCFSSATSLSNGFHSKESSLTDVSDQNELEETQQIKHKESKKMVPVKDSYGMEDDLELKHNGHLNGPSNGISNGAFQRGTNVTNSFRRKISLGKHITSEDLPQKYVEDNSEPMSNPTSLKSKEAHWKSLESLDDLDVEDEIDSKQDSENGDDDAPKMILVRRDSKRFNKGDAERVIQGFFIESKNTSNGTLRRIKVPLNIDEFADTSGDKSLEGILDKSNDEICSQNGRLPSHDSDSEVKTSHKKKISVDDNILSTASELEDNSYATDATQSDVFHSIINSPHSEDKTIQSDGDDEDVTLDIDTPDDMEESILEQLESIATTPVDREMIPELLAEEELEDERRWKSFRVGASDIQIDLKAIQPYRRVLSHGGYLDAERKVAIILFSGCYLPDRSRKEYSYLMDHLFLYVLSSLEELIVEDYILVYLHGATPKSCMPTFSWLKRCYQLIDHRLRKNLKGLYLVHPTFWLKTVVALTKPFVSGKFSRKLEFVNTLADLCLIIPTEHLVIPDRVLHYDFQLKLEDLRRQNKLS